MDSFSSFQFRFSRTCADHLNSIEFANKWGEQLGGHVEQNLCGTQWPSPRMEHGICARHKFQRGLTVFQSMLPFCTSINQEHVLPIGVNDPKGSIQDTHIRRLPTDHRRRKPSEMYELHSNTRPLNNVQQMQ